MKTLLQDLYERTLLGLAAGSVVIIVGGIVYLVVGLAAWLGKITSPLIGLMLILGFIGFVFGFLMD